MIIHPYACAAGCREVLEPLLTFDVGCAQTLSYIWKRLFSGCRDVSGLIKARCRHLGLTPWTPLPETSALLSHAPAERYELFADVSTTVLFIRSVLSYLSTSLVAQPAVPWPQALARASSCYLQNAE